MTISFALSPLVEIIAEVRWKPKGQPITAVAIGPQPTQGLPLLTDGSHEGFFSDLANGAAEAGFERSERLVPISFPAMPQQVVCRFRGKDTTKIFQAGLGVFSINAVPPYRSWEDFRPVVDRGLGIFVEARRKNSLDPVSEILLRYVNLFDRTLIDHENAASFTDRIAGIQMSFPKDIAGSLADPKSRKMDFTFGAKLEWGAMFKVHIADAIVDGRTGVLLDSTVSVSELSLTAMGDISELFERAHTVTRQTFLSLTRPLYERMKPTGH